MEEKISIGVRIREERERLRLTQHVLGVTPQSQRKYEKGESTPGADYLSNFARLGADILYVVTGQRAGVTVSDEHARLIAAYDAAPSAIRAAAMAVLGSQAVADSAPDDSPSTSASSLVRITPGNPRRAPAGNQQSSGKKR